jgi:hypothetical protein
MAKVRKMAMGGFLPPEYGGDQSATGGLGRVNTGAGTIGSALKTASSAIGGDNGDTIRYPIDLPTDYLDNPANIRPPDSVVGTPLTPGMPYRKKGGSIKNVKRMAGGGNMTFRAPDYPTDSGDGTAFGGLREVQGGAGTVGSALKTATGAIGSDNEPYLNNQTQYKRGGSAKADSGRIYIGTSKISTAQKNKKHSNCW